MKAAIIKEPGVINVEEVAKPSANVGEVLLKVEACALCGTDQRVLKGEKNVDVPIVGHEIVGTVEEIGEGVEKVKIGDRYAVQTVIGCGDCAYCNQSRENLCLNGFTAIGYQYNGGFADYMVMPENSVKQGCLISISSKMTAEVGTILEPLSCCVNGMRCIPLEEMEHVLIFGGGIIGVLNGLVAKARGTKKVTIMDVSDERLALHQRLGLPFDNFINSGKTDPVEEIDLNIIHYRELHVHGANSSVQRDYIEARNYIESGKIDAAALVTHKFRLEDFKEAVEVQGNPASGAMKVVIFPGL